MIVRIEMTDHPRNGELGAAFSDIGSEKDDESANRVDETGLDCDSKGTS